MKILVILLVLLSFSTLFIKKRERFKCATPKGVNKIFVINLDRDKSRYERINQRLDMLGVEFERVSGVDGGTLDIDKLKEDKKIIFRENSFFGNTKKNRNSLQGSIGCAFSHRKIWKIIKDQKYDKALILEDDVVIPNNITSLIEKLEYPEGWDIIFLGGIRIQGTRVHGFIKAVTTETNGWRNCGLYAYIINKKSAKKLLELTDPLYNYIDIQLNRNYDRLNAYYADPLIIEHDFRLPSTRLNNTDDSQRYSYTDRFIERTKGIRIVEEE